MTAAEAAKWHYDLTEGEINVLMTYALGLIERGEIYTYELPGAVGNVLSIPNMGEMNKPLAAKLNSKVEEYLKQMR